jgi:hypothetical protein
VERVDVVPFVHLLDLNVLDTRRLLLVDVFERRGVLVEARLLMMMMLLMMVLDPLVKLIVRAPQGV